jgi:hypothetical protein
MIDRKWINNHPKTTVLAVSLALLMLVATIIVTYLPQIREQLESRRRRRQRELRMTTRKKYTPPAVKATLAFEKVPLQIKELSGEIRPLKRRGNAIGCGDSVDVMWFRNQVLFMKEKGLFEQVLVARDAPFSDLEWDGQNIWVAVPKKGIWILDTSGRIVAELDSEEGLPPGEKGLLLNTIEPGKIFAVGSFGPRERGWCAIVELKNCQPSINVFHEARRVPSEFDDKEDIRHDPDVVFRPYGITECLAFTQDFDPNITYYRPYSVRLRQAGGRRTLFIRRCEKKYSRHTLIYPLEVDLDALSVRVASQKKLYLGKQSVELDYRGKVYFPGRVWYCADPNTRRKEKLVTRGKLPAPYGSLRSYWVSAHYGLAGWTADRQLYQIRVADEEQDMTPPHKGEDRYYHFIVFEDANGAKPQGVRTVRLEIHRQDKPTLKYTAAVSGKSGYYPVGRYEAWGSTRIREGKKRKVVKVCDFEPIEVTEDSPVRLVMRAKPVRTQVAVATGPDAATVSAKVAAQPPPTVVPSEGANTAKQKVVKKDDSIVYAGQVVHAITGEPMAGAFVMTGFKSNLAWITPEEWEKLHKLPVNPLLSDDALWPIKNTSDFKLKGIARTDPNGRFEMKLRRGEQVLDFVAFEQDYCSATVSKDRFGPLENNRVQLPKVSLFPAAKVMIEPRVDYSNVWLRFFPESEDGREGPGYGEKVEKNLKQPCYIPAGHRYRLEFSIPYDDEWCIPEIPQRVKLKQSETLDLGRFVFEPAIKILIKVIDSESKPAVGVRLIRSYDDPYHNVVAHKTDENGITSFHVEPSSEIVFSVLCNCPGNHVVKTAAFRIGGREDEGKEFTIQL